MSDQPRIVCIGANVESDVVLRGLAARAIPIAGLVTKPAGQVNGASDYVDLHPWCEQEGIPVHDTADINSEESLEAIRLWKPDYLFTLGWNRLFRRALLDVPSEFCVGSHPSPLPAGRGRAPLPWTILQGHKRTAVSLFRMDRGVDAGPILLQKWIDVPEGVYVSELYRQIASTLRDAFCELYELLAQGEVEERPQEISRASFRAKRTPADGFLDFGQSAQSLQTLVRAVAEPYPGAYAYYQDQRINIWRASNEDIPDYTGTKGQILLRQDDRLLVQAGDTPLWVWKLTSDEGAPLSTDIFRRGTNFNYRLQDEIHQLRAELSHIKNLFSGQ